MKKKTVVILSVVVLGMVMMSCSTFYGEQASEEDRFMQIVKDYPDISHNELFVMVNTWFVSTFNSAESVIEYSDKEAGRVMGKYTFEYMDTLNTYRVRTTISVDVKDGKTRLMMEDPMVMLVYSGWTGERGTYGYQPLTAKAGVEKARNEWMNLAASMDSVLSEGKSDW